MKYFLISILVFSLGCTGTSSVSKKLSGSDSLVIHFYAANSDSIVKVVSTEEEKAIEKLSRFVSASETELFKCGYDGNLYFFEKSKLVSNVSFKYSEVGCRHFLQDADGKLVSTKMSNEAADFLKSLAEGRDSYW